MNLNSSFKFNKSFHILLIIIVFSVLADETPSTDLNYEACVPQNCGNVLNISYPFWIANQQKSYCGNPNFEVTCNDQNPVLNSSGDDYVIKDIFYSTKNSFLLVNAMAYYIDNTCPILLHNFSIGGTPYNYSLSYADLFFFYDCSSNPTVPTYRVDCASKASQFYFAVHKKFLEFQNYPIESCHSWVNAPVEIEDFLKMNFTDVLRKRFVLKWTEDHCSDCKRSGGKCVSINDEFTCFCLDRPHSKTCDDGDGLNLLMKCAIGFGAAGGTLLVALVLFIYHRRCNKKHNATSSWISRITSSYTSSMTDLEKDAINYGVQTFSYNELEKATNNFDSRKEIGDGGFVMKSLLICTI